MVVPAGIAFAVVGLAGSPAVDRILAEGILAGGNCRRSCERSVSQCGDAISAKSLQTRTGDTSAVGGVSAMRRDLRLLRVLGTALVVISLACHFSVCALSVSDWESVDSQVEGVENEGRMRSRR